jgi:carbon-monoxide dehydrogenase medium subunit
VVLIGAAERPMRLEAVERQLSGVRGPEALARAAAVATEGVTMRDDLFASAEYRKHLTRVLTGRALTQALERAGG